MRVRFLPFVLVASLSGWPAHAAERSAGVAPGCLAMLSMAHEVVLSGQGPGAPVTEDLLLRTRWEARKSAVALPIPRAETSGARLLLVRDRALWIETVANCLRRQDAHPAFRQMRLEAELHGVPDSEPLDVSESLSQLARLLPDPAPRFAVKASASKDFAAHGAATTR